MMVTKGKEATSADRASPVPRGMLQMLLVAALAAILVMGAYIWFVSVGAWTEWPLGGSYYDQLANAFRDGHLWLERTPSRELLALPDPYDPAAREGVSFISDASLFNGRYYLYFGPVPALLVAGLKSIFPVLIGDQYLVFAFTAGTFLVLVAFIIRTWQRFFSGVSAWLVTPALLAIGLMSPFAWILGSRASVHDAAIAAGQFFLLLGLYTAWTALDRGSISKGRGLLAGIFWTASLGSRITQIVPIAFLLLMVGAAVLRWHAGNSRADALRAWLIFVGPVGLGLGALGWYNWARFGSVFETGISYQLALLHIQAHRGELFSMHYLIQNAYNYVLMPPKLRYNFPYVWPQMGIRHPILAGVRLPSLYFAEDITGLVFTSPFMLCGLALMIAAPTARRSSSGGQEEGRTLQWLQAALAGVLLLGFVMFLLFFWGSERYLMDFLPAGLLLAIMGSWSVITRLRDHPGPRAAVVLLVLTLMVISALVSSLLAIALNADGFRQIDPVLWQQLNNVFR
jgi:hypothetical protein